MRVRATPKVRARFVRRGRVTNQRFVRAEGVVFASPSGKPSTCTGASASYVTNLLYALMPSHRNFFYAPKKKTDQKKDFELKKNTLIL